MLYVACSSFKVIKVFKVPWTPGNTYAYIVILMKKFLIIQFSKSTSLCSNKQERVKLWQVYLYKGIDGTSSMRDVVIYPILYHFKRVLLYPFNFTEKRKCTIHLQMECYLFLFHKYEEVVSCWGNFPTECIQTCLFYARWMMVNRGRQNEC